MCVPAYRCLSVGRSQRERKRGRNRERERETEKESVREKVSK